MQTQEMTVYRIVHEHGVEHLKKMHVEFAMVTTHLVLINVAYQMVTIPPVPMHAVYPMVITHHVQIVLVYQMVTM